MSQPTLLEKRRIEAEVLIPFIRNLQAKFGDKAIVEVLEQTIVEHATLEGEKIAKHWQQGNSNDLANNMQPFLNEGSLAVEITERCDKTFAFDVKRCQFQEMYQQLQADDLGYSLSCVRDQALFAAAAPQLRFSRSQTRMQGADVCDFCFTSK